MSPILNEIQKRRLATLKPQFEKAIASKDLEAAKIILNDIQSTLNINNHKTLLAKYKNWFFELALDLEQYSYAENGFIGIRKLVSKNTRIYLEASSLLAICYLRIKQIEKAKPLIQEVLRNDKVIKTERTRQRFKKQIIQRFDEEVALYSLKEKHQFDYNLDEIEEKVGLLVATKSEDELFRLLGQQTPQATKNLLFEVDNFAKKQLSYSERKLLASPEDLIKDEEAGRTIFQSFKRTIYNSICDKNSEVYKMWNNKIAGAVFDTRYLIGAITLALASSKIGIMGLIITAAALVIRFGLDFYCLHYQPKGIMETRKE